jgi:type VI protein secretion system component Hcp
VLVESASLAVPKAFKNAGAFPVTVTMQLNYLLPVLLSQARAGKSFEKTVRFDAVRTTNSAARKLATYKLATTTVTSLTISESAAMQPLVQVELSPRRLGVTAYTYTDAGVQEKSTTFCWDLGTNTSSCSGI